MGKGDDCTVQPVRCAIVQTDVVTCRIANKHTHAQHHWPLAHGHCRCISTSGICWSRRLKSVQRSRTFSAFGAAHGSVRVYFITRHGCHKILHLCPPRSFVKASTKITLGFPIRCAPRQPRKKPSPRRALFMSCSFTTSNGTAVCGFHCWAED